MLLVDQESQNACALTLMVQITDEYKYDPLTSIDGRI